MSEYTVVEIPTKTLNNGQKIPVLGLGTWRGAEGVVGSAVETALKVGYRQVLSPIEPQLSVSTACTCFARLAENPN